MRSLLPTFLDAHFFCHKAPDESSRNSFYWRWITQMYCDFWSWVSIYLCHEFPFPQAWMMYEYLCAVIIKSLLGYLCVCIGLYSFLTYPVLRINSPHPSRLLPGSSSSHPQVLLGHKFPVPAFCMFPPGVVPGLWGMVLVCSVRCANWQLVSLAL